MVSTRGSLSGSARGLHVALVLLVLLGVSVSSVWGDFVNPMTDPTGFTVNGGSFSFAGYSFISGQTVTYGAAASIPAPPYTLTFTLSSSNVPNFGGMLLYLSDGGSQLVDLEILQSTANIRLTLNNAVGQTASVQTNWGIPMNTVTIIVTVTSTGGTITFNMAGLPPNAPPPPVTTFTFTNGPPTAFQTTTFQIGDILNTGFASTISDLAIQTTGSISGDPQFFGFHGQSYQIHGFPNEIMNLVTMKDFQWHSMFVFLDGTNRVMTRERYNHTQRYTHPGTYLGKLFFSTPSANIHITAGSFDQGLTVSINDHAVPFIGSVMAYNVSDLTLTMTSKDQVVINSRYLSVIVDNSDWFVNIGVHQHNLKQSAACEKLATRTTPYLLPTDPYLTACTLHDVETGELVPMHGLVGGTYRNIRFAQGRLYEGEPDDYRVASGKPDGTGFLFNLYEKDY